MCHSLRARLCLAGSLHLRKLHVTRQCVWAIVDARLSRKFWVRAARDQSPACSDPLCTRIGPTRSCRHESVSWCSQCETGCKHRMQTPGGCAVCSTQRSGGRTLTKKKPVLPSANECRRLSGSVCCETWPPDAAAHQLQACWQDGDWRGQMSMTHMDALFSSTSTVHIPATRQLLERCTRATHTPWVVPNVAAWMCRRALHSPEPAAPVNHRCLSLSGSTQAWGGGGVRLSASCHSHDAVLQPP